MQTKDASGDTTNDRCKGSAGFDHAEVLDLCQNNIIEDLSVGEIVIIAIVLFMLVCCIFTIIYYNYKVPHASDHADSSAK